MTEFPRPTLSKIPGGCDLPKAKEDSSIKDLTKLTMLELMDLKSREEKLLAKITNLKRLPDKGKRLKDFYDRIKAELERRSSIDEAAALFSDLNIADKGTRTVNELEWSSGRSGVPLDQIDPSEEVLDSDDELELDPLRILAQHTMHERRVKILTPERSLITAEDLEEIKSFNDESNSTDSGISGNAGVSSTKDREELEEDIPEVNAEIMAIDVAKKLQNIKPNLHKILGANSMSSSKSDSSSSNSHCSTPAPSLEIEPHMRYIVEKSEISVPKSREKFRPYRTTKTNVHDPEKERQRKQGKHWEVTAATPPPMQHNGAKLISLIDSVEIQASYLQKIKELQEQQAAERLAARLTRLEGRKLLLPSKEELMRSAAFTTYRNAANPIEGSQNFNEEDETDDLLDERKPGGVVTYTVTEEMP